MTGALLGLAAWTAAGAEAPLLVDALTHLVALNVVPALADLPAATPVEGGRILRAALLAAAWTRTVPSREQPHGDNAPGSGCRR
ncbi:hypothetical protein [Amycolatopsis thermophila]|uniref:Uncharacterized protein n=1 Tax=Amycolatopsis thermophila TaxID=206084 RepID=A0ABU0F5S2_9PSEU|nr:hypothetical protein [Amycolatopsis thermophila]MDQ0382916.1 hypothetical protein [Amycolatopsis thermophila]